MSLGAHLTPVKQRASITVVIPAERRVEGRLRDGAPISIQVWEVPGAFVWPDVGEIWTVQRTGSVWMLGSRIETFDEDSKISELEPGQGQIDANVIVTRDGRTFVAVDLTNIEHGDSIVWDAATETFVRSPA